MNEPVDPKEAEVEVLLKEATAHGLTEALQGPFLLWLGNEIFEGREVSSMPVLTARAKELVALFRNAMSLDRQPRP